MELRSVCSCSCWLAGVDQNKQFDFAKPMFWGFLLPVGLILVYNIVLLVVTALTTCKTDPTLRRWMHSTKCSATNRVNSKWELTLVWQINPLTCFFAAPRKPPCKRSSWFASLWLCYWVFPGVWDTWCSSWRTMHTMSWASSSASAKPHRCELLFHLYSDSITLTAGSVNLTKNCLA